MECTLFYSWLLFQEEKYEAELREDSVAIPVRKKVALPREVSKFDFNATMKSTETEACWFKLDELPFCFFLSVVFSKKKIYLECLNKNQFSIGEKLFLGVLIAFKKISMVFPTELDRKKIEGSILRNKKKCDSRYVIKSILKNRVTLFNVPLVLIYKGPFLLQFLSPKFFKELKDLRKFVDFKLFLIGVGAEESSIRRSVREFELESVTTILSDDFPLDSSIRPLYLFPQSSSCHYGLLIELISNQIDFLAESTEFACEVFSNTSSEQFYTSTSSEQSLLSTLLVYLRISPEEQLDLQLFTCSSLEKKQSKLFTNL